MLPGLGVVIHISSLLYGAPLDRFGVWARLMTAIIDIQVAGGPPWWRLSPALVGRRAEVAP
jgi:hypothetical protein